MGTTNDTLFDGKIVLSQPARGQGYRVNVDAVLLAAFAAGTLPDALAKTPRRARAAFDLGAGVGAVGLSLLHLGAADHVTMVEIDTALAQMAESNALANRWTDRVRVIVADVSDQTLISAGVADLIVCNPPYVELGRGRAPAPARARARSGPLDVFLDAARRLAGRRARVFFVYPAIEATTLLSELRTRGLEPKRIRAVHATARDQARVLLVECVAGRPGGLVLEPPLIEARVGALGTRNGRS